MSSIATPLWVSALRTHATPPLFGSFFVSPERSPFFSVGLRRKNLSKVLTFCRFDGNNGDKFQENPRSCDESSRKKDQRWKKDLEEKKTKIKYPEPPWPVLGQISQENPFSSCDEVSFTENLEMNTINGCGFPISLRIIKMKRRLASNWPETLPVSLVSSVIKTISSVVLMIDELLSLIFNGELTESAITLSRETSDSLVLLFKKVFFRSLNLFLWILNLLADFIVFSAENSTGISIVGGLLRKQLFDLGIGDYGNNTCQDDKCFDRRRDAYERLIGDDPENSLILSNYAQFLYRIAKDQDRAEELFARAVRAEPIDAEALSQYAMFLWQKRGDMEGAEEAFLAALDIEPRNCYHQSNYASFLWETGGSDTCYPL